MRDQGYSPDVEIDEKGRVVLMRDVYPGETIRIPMHMMRRLAPKLIGSRGK